MATIPDYLNFRFSKSKFVISLKILIRKGYNLTTIVNFLRQIYFAKNIDNLLVLLAGPSSNTIN